MAACSSAWGALSSCLPTVVSSVHTHLISSGWMFVSSLSSSTMQLCMILQRASQVYVPFVNARTKGAGVVFTSFFQCANAHETKHSSKMSDTQRFCSQKGAHGRAGARPLPSPPPPTPSSEGMHTSQQTLNLNYSCLCAQLQVNVVDQAIA